MMKKQHKDGAPGAQTDIAQKDSKEQPDYLKKLDELHDQLLDDLTGLIKIKSVKGEPSDGAPFGAGVDQAFRYMLDLGEREGLECTDINGYGGHIDFGNKTDDGIM